MTLNISALKEHKQSKLLSTYLDRLDEMKKHALTEFNSLVSTGTVVGLWNDPLWKYQNSSLYFTKPFDSAGNLITSTTKPEAKIPLEGFWSDLIKIYAITNIKKAKTTKAVRSTLGALIWLAHITSYEPFELVNLKQEKLDKLIPILEKHFERRGPYERLKEIVSFTKKFLIPNRLCRSFLVSINMKNPALSQADVTSSEYQERRDKKYEADVDRYIGLVKQRFDADQKRIENNLPPLYSSTKPLYDELRLLAVPFLMAFGLRVGELCTLPVDCLQYDEVNERWYLNVLTEKGQLPSARPVPRMWQEIIVESYNKILKVTEPFRKHAQAIETNPRQAIWELLSFNSRSEYLIQELKINGYDPDAYFFKHEVDRVNGHPSGLTYSKLRWLYKSAEVGKVRILKSSRKLGPVSVISKETVIQLALKEYENSRKIIYKENSFNVDSKGAVSSTSFSVELPYSKMLFIAKESTFDLGSSRDGILPRPMTVNNFTNWVTDDKGSRNRTVFERFDIRTDEGKVVSLNTHQFRHWLTTALMRSGKSEMMVDLFMGRSPGQTRHYDHRTSKERAEEIRKKYLADELPDDVLGRRVKRMRENKVTLSEIENALNHTLSVVHFTPWGTCKRDLDVSPCEKGMMCLRGDEGHGCQHFGINPDDQKAKASIINTLRHYENQISILLPDYDKLASTLNNYEPLDQHIQFCIDTIKGCENALKAYERAEKHKGKTIDVVQVFVPGDTV
jgi:hypothetical protein